MPDYRRRNCAPPPKGCGKSDAEVGDISWSGLCLACGLRRLEASVVEQQARKGPIFQEWRAGMAASVGGVLLDERRASA